MNDNEPNGGRKLYLDVTDIGHGFPVVFQHGLGGDRAQVAENFPDDAPFRRITVECRGHGHSEAGWLRPLSIPLFASDILNVCDERGIERFVVGGISMGAAIALHIAVRHPDRVAGLILARPAWVFDSAPDNMRPFAEVAALLREKGPVDGRIAFAASATGQDLAVTAPDNLASLLGFFDRPDPALTADLLGAIAIGGPEVTKAEVSALSVPTLVIGNAVDHVHPLAHAQTLAEVIPGAQFVEIASKAVDRVAHAAEFRAAVSAFLGGLNLG